MNVYKVTNQEVETLCLALGDLLARLDLLSNLDPSKVYGIGESGVGAAYALASQFNIDITDNPNEADFFMQSVMGCGSTLESFSETYPGKPFIALVDPNSKAQVLPFENVKGEFPWIQFPWEKPLNSLKQVGIENTVQNLLAYVGEDIGREGLLETPKRVAKAWNHWCSGYGKDAGEILKVFEDGAEGCDEMVVVKDIPIYSHCEHHLAAIIGTATIAYIPNGKIVGLSKLSRLADMFARRLQVQERLTNQIADALQEHLDPLGVGVVIKARHMCMESRGISQQGHHTITSALRGVIKEQPETRAEFLNLAN